MTKALSYRFLGAFHVWLLSAPLNLNASPIALVTNGRTNEVIVFNLNANQVVKRIVVGRSPRAIVFGADYAKAFVSAEGEVSVIDTLSLKVEDKVPLEGRGTALAVPPDGDQLYVGVRGQAERDRLDLFSLSQKRRLRTVPIGEGVSHILASPDGRQVYVTNHNSFNVHIFDTPTLNLVREILVAPLGKGAWDKPHYMAPTRNFSRFYMPFQGRALVEVDTLSLTLKVHQKSIDSASTSTSTASPSPRTARDFTSSTAT